MNQLPFEKLIVVEDDPKDIRRKRISVGDVERIIESLGRNEHEG